MENYTTTVKPVIQVELNELEQFELKRLSAGRERPDPKSSYTIRASVYARVSTGPQAAYDKVSIPEQIEKAKEVIEASKWRLVDIYEDHKPTTHETDFNERPDMARAVKDARLGKYDVLIVWIDSRLGRNPEQTKKIRKELKDHGVQVYSVKKPSLIVDPRFFVPKRDRYNHIIEGFNDLVSEADSYEFTEKMKFGKMQRAKQGYLPGQVSYGYKRRLIVVTDEDGKQQSKSEVYDVPEEQLIARQMFELYLDGTGIRGILNVLSEKGIKNRSGKPWNYSSLRYLLKNPIYAGYVRFGWRLSDSKESRENLNKGITGIVVKGHHTAVITEEMYVNVQKKIDLRAKVGGRVLGSKGLLSGRIKCPICGSSGHLTTRPSSYAYKKCKDGFRKDDYCRCRFYVCSKTSKYGSRTCTRYIGSQPKIDNLVVQEIKRIAMLDSTEKAFQKEIQKSDTNSYLEELSILKTRLKTLSPKREKFDLAFADGLLRYEDYGKHVKELNQEEVDLNASIENLNSQIKDCELHREKIQTTLSAFKDFDRIWDQSSMDKKKDLINSLIDKVIYSKGKLRIEYKSTI